MNATFRVKRPLPTTDRVECDRRKIRRGTLSCWECKRRKVRCTFADSSASTCDGCKRRQTSCVSQEFPDEPAKVDSNEQLCDRLTKLERVVHCLVEKVDIVDGAEQACHHSTLSPAHSRAETCAPLHQGQASRRHKAASVILDHDSLDGAPLRKQTCSAKTFLSDTDRAEESELAGVEYESLCRMLVNAWPRPRDLEVIFDLSIQSSGLFHGIMSAPFSAILHGRRPSLREHLQLPPPGSHPCLIARKLLILATYLQSLPPSCTRILDESRVDYRSIMSCAVKTANSCVISNDALLESVEGIESIMMESTYQSNAGNLRTAWHLVGRAILIAQLMGLHRTAEPQSLNMLDTETRTRVHPEYLWLRLIQINRYLSLMLGMLQSTPSNTFADHQILEGCTPAERLQRLDCAAAGYILQRNEAALYDDATTNMIDQMLQTSASSLPPTWWLVPDLESSAHDETETLEHILRVMDQLTHYHLVSQLHFPHLLHSRTDHKYDYSKTMAVNASREVLVRLTSLNGTHSFISFCRGISFLAFIACTTLCIVHIDAKRRREHLDHSQGPSLDLLVSQKQSDRNMMGLALQCMQRMARESEDSIAFRTASVLKDLLSMEADATICGEYVATLSTEERTRGLGCGGKVSDCGKRLQIHIPYVGTINFERDNTYGLVSTGGQY